jgi:hypothetical protein
MMSIDNALSVHRQLRSYTGKLGLQQRIYGNFNMYPVSSFH